ASPRARSRGGPALVATSRAMHLAWSARQTSGQVSVSRTTDGIAWSEPFGADGHTNVAPSMCALGAKIVLAWTEQDGRIAFATSTDDGASFGPKSVILDAASDDGPALIEHEGAARLFFADKKSGRIVMMKSADGASFDKRTELPFSSKHSPAA